MKLINDTLKNTDGKWSRKSLQMFVSFSVSIILGAAIVFIPAPNEYAIEVFYGFLFLAGGTTVVTLFDKINTRGSKQKNETKELS